MDRWIERNGMIWKIEFSIWIKDIGTVLNYAKLCDRSIELNGRLLYCIYV